jgi:hypothetical protein
MTHDDTPEVEGMPGASSSCCGCREHSFKNQTGPAVGTKKTETSEFSGFLRRTGQNCKKTLKIKETKMR